MVDNYAINARLASEFPRHQHKRHRLNPTPHRVWINRWPQICKYYFSYYHYSQVILRYVSHHIQYNMCCIYFSRKGSVDEMHSLHQRRNPHWWIARLSCSVEQKLATVRPHWITVPPTTVTAIIGTTTTTTITARLIVKEENNQQFFRIIHVLGRTYELLTANPLEPQLIENRICHDKRLTPWSE